MTISEKKKIYIVSLISFAVSFIFGIPIFLTIFKKSNVLVKNSSTQSNANKQVEEKQEREKVILDIPADVKKVAECPITGQFYTQMEKDRWDQRRPLFVMIENSPSARPQSGLSHSDVVYEAIAEGGVTRYGAVFFCDAQKYDVTLAPIRSARMYFIKWAQGYNKPLYVHVGGANLPGPADAIGYLAKIGWNLRNDMNQFSIGWPTFVRNYDRIQGKNLATEHTMETTTEALWNYAKEKRNITNVMPPLKYSKSKVDDDSQVPWEKGFRKWKFEEPNIKPQIGDVKNISYLFWKGYNDYKVDWTYDEKTDSYLRTLAGVEDKDLNNDQRISAKNVVVLFTKEEGPIDELKHMLYKTEGTGTAYIFKHGTVTKVTWIKKTPESRIVFTDTKTNKEFPFARGRVWISVIGDTFMDLLQY